MTTYVFAGKIHPEWSSVWVKIPPFHVSFDDARLEVDVQINIDSSQISVLVSTDTPPEDMATLNNLVEATVRSVVDVVGFDDGSGYDVQLTTVTASDGSHWQPIGVTIPALARTRRDRPIEFGDIWGVLTSGADNNHLRRALADLRESIRSPQDTGFFCYRAVESIRQSFARKRDRHDSNRSWDRMREALNLEKSWLMFLEQLSVSVRHGGYPYISAETRAIAMLRAWQVVYRYIEFLKRNRRRLPKTKFALLNET